MKLRPWLVAMALLTAAPVPARADDPFLRRTATVRAVEKVGPAVVNITTERVVSRRSPFSGFRHDPFFDQFFRDFFEPRRETLQSLGSGVIIDPQRHVLTNEHVVTRASRIKVSLSDGREFEATLVGADPHNDLAVLRIETDEALPWVRPGHSDDLLVGEPVIAIGNPFGLSNTVTTGVISALDRSIKASDRAFHGFIQTDASINPGNSGGPLLNAEGTLVAINTAIYNGAQGIGFAIPIDVAKRVVAELIEHGEVQPVWLGLEFQDLDPALQEVMELPEGVFGALINRVRKGGPADRAGFERGDIVTKLDGRPVRSARSFFEMLGTVTDGQRLQIEAWRDSDFMEIAVVAEDIPDSLVAELTQQFLGMELQALDGEARGFVVQSVRSESASARIGIRRGDLLLGVNGLPLRNTDDLRRAVLNLRGRDRALIVVQRGNGRYHVTIPLV
ncbi:MAG: trypsin-like peptidase domain-containing protein [Proteobacteria bacterium]|nr:trypsin-like peptidase domain-containing protein [Pseudomonadota bacterium]